MNNYITNMKHYKYLSVNVKQRHDIYVTWKLFKRFKFKNVVIVADKGYFDYGLFKLMKLKNNYLLFPPKNYSGKCRHNNILRRNIKEHYHKLFIYNHSTLIKSNTAISF